MVAERRGGANKCARPEYQNDLIDRFLTSATVFHSDSATASIYGDICGALADAGAMISTTNIWTAAPAFQHALPLATGDAHFAYVPGLTTSEKNAADR